MGGLPVMRNAIMHSAEPLRECFEVAYYGGEHVLNPGIRSLMIQRCPDIGQSVHRGRCGESGLSDSRMPAIGEVLWEALYALVTNQEPRIENALIDMTKC